MSEETLNKSMATLFSKIGKVQDSVGLLVKEGKNPHFGSKFTKLPDAVALTRPAMSKAGLVLIQPPSGTVDIGGVLFARVDTTIGDTTTGASITGTIEIPIEKKSGQAMGSAITYARRYAILSMLGLGDKDDDGEGAGKDSGSRKNQSPRPPYTEAKEATTEGDII